MNPKTRSRGAVLAAALAVGLGLTAPAQGQQQKAPQKLTFGYVDGTDVVSIEVNGEDITVLLNGEEMPEKRYQRQGNVVRCRDVHGRLIAVLNLWGTAGTLQTLPRRPHRLRLGVTLNPPTSALAEHLGLEVGDTLFISQVMPDKAGDKAGLRKHDIITQIEGKTPATKQRLGEALAKKEPGQSLALRIVRRGEARDVEVVLEAEDDEALSVLGYDVLSPGELDFTTIATPDLLYSGEFLATPQVSVPYVFDTGQAVTLDLAPYTRVKGVVPEADRKGEHDEGGDEQLRQLEKRLSSLEKMLEKALERLNHRVK